MTQWKIDILEPIFIITDDKSHVYERIQSSTNSVCRSKLNYVIDDYLITIKLSLVMITSLHFIAVIVYCIY